MANEKQSKRDADKAKRKAEKKVKDTAEQAKDQAVSQAAVQKERATENLTEVAEALRQTSDSLHKQNQDAFGRYANQAADQVERFAGHLRERSPGELLDEAKEYAQREPALFLGGAFALGVLGARFLKSSSPDSAADRHYSRQRSRRSDIRRGQYDEKSSIPSARDTTSQAGRGASETQ
jgi:hypothetical protein